MIKKFAALALVGASLSACSVYKNVELDSALTPQAHTFLSQNGLADKRQYNEYALTPELQSYLKEKGRININGITSNSDCHDFAGALGFLMTAGAWTVECQNFINISYESGGGQISKEYKQEYEANKGGWLQAPVALGSKEWSVQEDETAQFNNSIITTINKIASEYGSFKHPSQ